MAAFHGERVIERLACSDRAAADAVGPDELRAGDRNAVGIPPASRERDGRVCVTRLGARVKDHGARTWVARVVELRRSCVGVLAGVFGWRLSAGARAGAAARSASAAGGRRAGRDARARQTLQTGVARSIREARPALSACDGSRRNLRIGSATRDGDGHQRNERHGESFHGHTPDGARPNLQTSRGAGAFATVTGGVTHGAFAWDVQGHF